MGLSDNRIKPPESMRLCVPNGRFGTVTPEMMVIHRHRMWTISDWIEKVLAPSQKIWVCIPALTRISSGIRVWPCFRSETLFILLYVGGPLPTVGPSKGFVLVLYKRDCPEQTWGPPLSLC